MMNIKEKAGKNNSFVIILEDYYGSGWAYSTAKAIKNNIRPESIKTNDIEVGTSHSEFELIFIKDELEIKVEIDDLGPVAIILKSNITDQNKQKLRDWAKIIAEEIEKLKKN